MTYSPAAVCELVGITPRRLRRWRVEGVVQPSARTGSGAQARYTRADIELVAAAWYLSEQGMPTQQLRELVKVFPGMLTAVSNAIIRSD